MSRRTAQPPPPAADPWQREAARMAELSDPSPGAPGAPLQSFVIEDPPGYGAAAVLHALHALLRDRNPSPAAVLMPTRLDGVIDWPTLADAILVNAHRAGLPHGLASDILMALRTTYNAAAFRTELDARLVDAIKQHGPLTLLLPNIERVLEAMPPNDHWAFRNVLQGSQLSLIATASPRWRPGNEEAFYEFFRWTRPKPAEAADIDRLGHTLQLSNAALRTLQRAADNVDHRPALLQAGALILASNPMTPLGELLQRIASGHPLQLHTTLSALAPQTRQVLAASVAGPPPITSSQITHTTGLPSAAVATHLTRLHSARILEPDRRLARNKVWTFTDGVLETLYRALVQGGPVFAEWLEAAQVRASPATMPA